MVVFVAGSSRCSVRAAGRRSLLRAYRSCYIHSQDWRCITGISEQLLLQNAPQKCWHPQLSVTGCVEDVGGCGVRAGSRYPGNLKTAAMMLKCCWSEAENSDDRFTPERHVKAPVRWRATHPWSVYGAGYREQPREQPFAVQFARWKETAKPGLLPGNEKISRRLFGFLSTGTGDAAQAEPASERKR